jgi:hypothetical protein
MAKTIELSKDTRNKIVDQIENLHNWWLTKYFFAPLYAAARPRKPISRNSRQTVIVLTLLPEAVWNSVVRVTNYFYTLRASALGGHVLWACVAYHFVTEPLLLLDVSTSQ